MVSNSQRIDPGPVFVLEVAFSKEELCMYQSIEDGLQFYCALPEQPANTIQKSVPVKITGLHEQNCLINTMSPVSMSLDSDIQKPHLKHNSSTL